MRFAVAKVLLLLLCATATYAREGATRPPNGSASVPVDSPVYAALERLGAWGLIRSQITGLRPWTRAECYRQVLEAASSVESRRDRLPDWLVAAAEDILAGLRSELEPPGQSANLVLDSIYVRAGGLAGTPLNDSFHFGQTIINDFGRPFGRGFNAVAGADLRLEAGRFFAFARTEAQTAGAARLPGSGLRDLIARIDGTSAVSEPGHDAIHRGRVLEAYAGVRAGSLSISLGRQSLYWGPTEDGPLSFSNNAEPALNLRIANTEPVPLPGPLSRFGTVRGEFVLGRLEGHVFPANPWFNAQKLSFKLTENLEMGFTRWSIFWGAGHPITFRSFARNFTSVISPLTPGGPADALDPGDRKGGFDFRYRIPGLRNWLTLYSDSYCDDDPSPLAAPRRAAINPGIFLTRIPGLGRADLRLEAPSTMPISGDHGPRFIYYNNQYPNGNTHNGYLLGSWVGRDARALRSWLRYWASSQTVFETGYRRSKGGSLHLPGGSTDEAAHLRAAMPLSGSWRAEAFVQAERFNISALGGRHRNLTASLRIVWQPHLPLKPKHSPQPGRVVSSERNWKQK